MKKIIFVVIACLVIGASGGYGTGYLLYEPKIKSYETQVSNLTAEVSNLTSEVSKLNQVVSNQDARILALESEKAGLESEKSALHLQKLRLESDLATAQQTIASYEKQTADLKSQISSSQNRLDKILGIKVTQNYQWVYKWQDWQWELPIPLSVYVEYFEKQRPSSGAYYVSMAKDPRDDTYIDQMVRGINEAALKEGFTEAQKLNFVIAFVQSLPYTVDKEATPYDEYPRYPVQTLFDRGGDCEDTSILVAALLDRMGYDVALLLLKDAQHMAVGVSLSGNYGSYYENSGKKYFYLETTGEGWEIGQIPPDITNTRAYIYPLRN